MNIILIEKDGTMYEKKIKSLDKLYSCCGYRSNKDFEKLYEWIFDSSIYELYGKKIGKKDNENNQFPYETYYGSLCVLKQNSNITMDEWNMLYVSITNMNEKKDNDNSSISIDETNSNSEEYGNTEGEGENIEDELNYEEYEEEQ
jgi:hypothetical protein